METIVGAFLGAVRRTATSLPPASRDAATTLLARVGCVHAQTNGAQMRLLRAITEPRNSTPERNAVRERRDARQRTRTLVRPNQRGRESWTPRSGRRARRCAFAAFSSR